MKNSFIAHNHKGKIQALFSFRLIPWMLDRSNIERKKLFSRLLQKLQQDIYDLDSYLESTWNLKEKTLKKKWRKIFKTLRKFGISKKKSQKWCQEIFVYQKQEIALRDKILPTHLSLAYFYFYKSCDIKLMRRLIYRADPSLSDIIPDTDWDAFDYLTEINDDIDDVFEDCDVFNCNRFLFALYANGKSSVGKEYLKFIGQIERKVKKRLAKEKKADRQYVLKHTLEIAKNTKSLLKTRLKSKQFKRISNAKSIRKWGS